MLCLLAFFSRLLLLIIYSNVAAATVDFYSIEKDLAEFNLTCYRDDCKSTGRDSLSSGSCHCGIQCVQLDTCCFDSHYVDAPQPQLKHTCRQFYEYGTYFVIDQCPPDSAWSGLCNGEWTEEDDVQKLVPVTSLFTTTTYKNYYCLRCHETTDDFLYWTVKIESESVQSNISVDEIRQSAMSLSYNKDTGTWMALYDENVGYYPVNLSVQIPPEIKPLMHYCMPNVISDCPNEWYDNEVRSKCRAYMSIKEVRKDDKAVKYYKNIHCALCNSESLNDISCKMMISVTFSDRTPFSFTFLLDINRSDGELVGKVEKCPGDEKTWDPYAKKCRKLTCALPGFKVKNGKCVEE